MILAESRLTRSAEREYDDFISRSFERATQIAAAPGTSSDSYRVGPFSLTVRTVGEGLRRLLSPALRPLLATEPAAGTEWEAIAVDGQAAGFLPPAEWTLPVARFNHKLRVHVGAGGKVLVADPDRGMWSMADTVALKALYWVRDAASLPEWEPAAPYRLLLHMIAQTEGLQLVHAAAVATRGRGVLLSGPGGSGKSTTTLATVMSGGTTAGEDFVLLAPGEPPIAHALYDTLKLTGMATDLFPEVAAAAANRTRDASEKARVHLYDLKPGSLRPAIAVNAVMSLRLGFGSRTQIRQANAIFAMKSLAPSSAFLLRVQMGETLGRISQFVRSVPAFDVELSDDPIEAAQAISTFMSEFPA